MKRVYLFRKFECPDGHVTHKFVDATDEAVLCESAGCRFAAVRPEVYNGNFSVHGDALDYIDHNLGPDPIHITSKTQRRALMAATGRTEFIRHTPVPGTDKSPHTTDWSKGSMDPYTLRMAEELMQRVYPGDKPVVHPADEVYEPVANAFSFEPSKEQAKELIEAMEGKGIL